MPSYTITIGIADERYLAFEKFCKKHKLEYSTQPALQQTHVMGSACDVVKWISKCPYNIDEATVPKAGIDAAPGLVVLNLSLSYKVWLDLQEVAKHCR